MAIILPAASPHRLDIHEAWHDEYRRRGLPALLAPPFVVVRTDAELTTLRVPAATGTTMQHQLVQLMTHAPALHRAGNGWTFLAARDICIRGTVLDILCRNGITAAGYAEEVRLPIGHNDETAWITEPGSRSLPRLSLLAALARRCLVSAAATRRVNK